jgi:hypothetical protein
LLGLKELQKGCLQARQNEELLNPKMIPPPMPQFFSAKSTDYIMVILLKG